MNTLRSLLQIETPKISLFVFISFLGGLLTLLGGLLSLWVNFLNRKRDNDKFERELFEEFNERYDKLNDNLSFLSDIKYVDNLDLVDFLKKKNSTIDNKTMYQVLIDYFNLCSEQYYWKKKKRISDEIWNAWHAGMMYYYEEFPIVKKLWEIETKEGGATSYYLKENEDFFKEDCAL